MFIEAAIKYWLIEISHRRVVTGDSPLLWGPPSDHPTSKAGPIQTLSNNIQMDSNTGCTCICRKKIMLSCCKNQHIWTKNMKKKNALFFGTDEDSPRRRKLEKKESVVWHDRDHPADEKASSRRQSNQSLPRDIFKFYLQVQRGRLGTLVRSAIWPLQWFCSGCRSLLWHPGRVILLHGFKLFHFGKLFVLLWDHSFRCP